MMKSVNAIIDKNGKVRLLEKIKIKKKMRAIVTILNNEESEQITLLSEKSLAKDWNRPEEDEAWKDLQ